MGICEPGGGRSLPGAQWLRLILATRPPGARDWIAGWSPRVDAGYTFQPQNNSLLHALITKPINYI